MKIVCIHQSAELYGSDRSFLQVIKYFCLSAKFEKISIILPRHGPLVAELEKLDVEIIFTPLSLLSKTFLKKLQWGKIIFPLFQFNSKRKILDSYDVVYVNTSVILDFYLLAPFLKNIKIIHIREIPSRWLAHIFYLFLIRAKADIIFNSHATLKSFKQLPNSIVIHNAFEGFKPVIVKHSKTEHSAPLKILLIGRINSWKGQEFAIDALSRLDDKNFILKIVGSVSDGNEKLIRHLQKEVIDLRISDKVKFIDFVDHPSDIFSWCDIVVVPSTKPEPFGRVAIEAMSLGKPVLGANHGGLSEIIRHDFTGYLFRPNDQDSFIKYVDRYQQDRNLLSLHGRNAFEVFQNEFSLKGFYKQLDGYFGNIHGHRR